MIVKSNANGELSKSNATRLELDYMHQGDIEHVAELEKLCFLDDAWPVEIYYDELNGDRDTVHLVVRVADAENSGKDQQVIANAGFQLMGKAAYITTLATHPSWRRRLVGEWLLLNLLLLALKMGATKSALHVRASNEAAVQLYQKLGFEKSALIDGYYGDEAALLLTLEGLDSESKSRRLEQALFDFS